MNGNRDSVYKKNPIEVISRQMQDASVKEVYIWQGNFQELDGGVHHCMKSKLFMDICNERNIKVMCSKRNNVVWNQTQEERETYFVEYIQIYTENPAITLKCSVLAVYPGYAVL